MATTNITKDKELIRLRDFSSAFSRSAFVDVLNYNDYSHFDWLLSNYDTLKSSTYIGLLRKSYSIISKRYRCDIAEPELVILLKPIKE